MERMIFGYLRVIREFMKQNYALSDEESISFVTPDGMNNVTFYVSRPDIRVNNCVFLLQEATSTITVMDDSGFMPRVPTEQELQFLYTIATGLYEDPTADPVYGFYTKLALLYDNPAAAAIENGDLYTLDTEVKTEMYQDSVEVSIMTAWGSADIAVDAYGNVVSECEIPDKAAYRVFTLIQAGDFDRARLTAESSFASTYKSGGEAYNLLSAYNIDSEFTTQNGELTISTESTEVGIPNVYIYDHVLNVKHVVVYDGVKYLTYDGRPASKQVFNLLNAIMQGNEPEIERIFDLI